MKIVILRLKRISWKGLTQAVLDGSEVLRE